MFVKQFLIGGDRNYAYLIADEATGKAAVVDPSYNPEVIVDFAREHNYEIVYIFNTHGHYDHTNGNRTIQRLTSVQPLLLGMAEPQSGLTVADGAKFPLGELDITIIHTPKRRLTRR